MLIQKIVFLFFSLLMVHSLLCLSQSQRLGITSYLLTLNSTIIWGQVSQVSHQLYYFQVLEFMLMLADTVCSVPWMKSQCIWAVSVAVSSVLVSHTILTHFTNGLLQVHCFWYLHLPISFRWLPWKKCSVCISAIIDFNSIFGGTDNALKRIGLLYEE